MPNKSNSSVVAVPQMESEGSFLTTSDLQEVFKACAAVAKTLTGASDAFARVVVGPAGDEEEEEEERSLGQTAPLTTQHASTTISG